MPSALRPNGSGLGPFFPDQTRRLRLKVATQPNRLDEACRATGHLKSFPRETFRVNQHQ